MDYLPVFLRLQHERVVVVGGGTIALRKVRSLLETGAQVTVIAPALHAELATIGVRGELRHIAAPFAAEHLEGAVAVVAATDDATVNAVVSHAAQQRRIPVNVVDDASLSTFIFPAIIDRAPILASGAGAAYLRCLNRRLKLRPLRITQHLHRLPPPKTMQISPTVTTSSHEMRTGPSN